MAIWLRREFDIALELIIKINSDSRWCSNAAVVGAIWKLQSYDWHFALHVHCGFTTRRDQEVRISDIVTSLTNSVFVDNGHQGTSTNCILITNVSILSVFEWYICSRYWTSISKSMDMFIGRIGEHTPSVIHHQHLSVASATSIITFHCTDAPANHSVLEPLVTARLSTGWAESVKQTCSERSSILLWSLGSLMHWRKSG